MIDIKTFTKPKKSAGAPGGGSSATYVVGVATEAEHATRADKAKKADFAEQANVANRSTSALSANYAAQAGDVDIESETLQRFLRKDEPAEGEEDVAEEVRRKVDFKKDATFEEAAEMIKGFTAHELAAFLKGFTIADLFGIDEYGDAILNTIKSLEYNNAAEQGFSIEKEDPNRDEYHQYITNLTVWGKMTMNELEVMKRTYAGGTLYFSPAGGKIAKVVPVSPWDDDESEWYETSEDMCVGWKCYLLADDGTAATENLWREGDQVRCQTMGRIAAGGTGQGSAANKSYWRTILKHGVSQQNEKIYDHKDNELFGGQLFAWIVIGKHSVQLDEYTEENAPAETRDIPEEGDVIVLDGSRTDPDRQNVLLLESHGSYAPRLVGYHGIDSYSHAGKDVCEVSPKGVQIRSEYFKLLAQGSSTSTVEIPNFRGAWNAATQYYKNDQVSYNNAIWTCLSDNTTSEPTDESTAWRKEVYGQKGVSISSTSVTYGISASGTEQPASWQSALPTATDSRPYLWTRTIVSYTDYTSTTSYSVGYKGKNGTNGKDAVSIMLMPSVLVFDAGSDGIVPSGVSKSAALIVRRGNSSIASEIASVSATSNASNYDDKAIVSSSGSLWVVKLSSSYISKVDVGEGDTAAQVSATSGFVTVSVKLTNNEAYLVQVPFQVNVAKFTGQLMLTTEKFSNEMSELSGKHRTLSDNYDRLAADLKTSSPSILTNYTSKIEQTARQISLTVSEKAVGRRNMLPGSALRKVGEGWGAALSGDWLDGTYTAGYYGDQGILTSDGIGGSNCFKAKCYYDGTNIQYPGMRWNADLGDRNIKIKSGKKYTISAWVKCNRMDVPIVIETLWQPEEKTDASQRKGSVPNSFADHFVKATNTWELISTTIDTTNAPYPYIEVNLFITHQLNGVTATAWFCRPMMEEGDTYNGWTPSPQDYDYIGGNLLDNTASLSLGGNLRLANGTMLKDGYNPGINAAYAKPSSGYIELAQWGQGGLNLPIGLQPNTDYIFSFWAKGTSLIAYAYRNDNRGEMVTEDSNGNFRNASDWDDGNTNFTLSSQWKRYWVHWRTKSRTEKLPQNILLRTTTEAWIAKPKLEVGCTMTDWTEKRTDLVDKQALLATGIDITNGKITITASNTIVRNNNGTTIALFDGTTNSINASLINADKIEVKHLWAKSGDGATKVGYLGNTEEDACKLSDGTLAPLFIGGTTAEDSPFYVTSKGAMHATSGYIGGFDIEDTKLVRRSRGSDKEMRLTEDGVFFENGEGEDIGKVKASFGISVASLTTAFYPSMMIEIKKDYRSVYARNAAIYLNVTGNIPMDAYSNYLFDDYCVGNHALFIENGDIAGFRHHVRIIKASCTISEMDTVIYVPVTGITLTLPDNPQMGQYYKFIQGAGGKQAFWIKSNSYKMYWNGVDTNGRTSFDSGTCNQTTEFIFLGDHWRVNWYREAAI